MVTLMDMYDTAEGEETRTLGLENAKKRRGQCLVYLDAECSLCVFIDLRRGCVFVFVRISTWYLLRC